MKLKLFLTIALALISFTATAGESTQGGIPLDSKWKHDLYAYAKVNVKHSIWGLAHSERNYHLAIRLAEQEKFSINKDVLFATAFLHDIGAIEPFRIKGVEHATRSVQIMEPLLKSYGLEDKFIAQVREAILAHMYDSEVTPQEKEAIVFHDADTLDFLGDIGVVRIVGLTDRHAWAPNLVGALVTLHGWETELPTKVITNSAKSIAKQRIEEMNEFFKGLKKYCVGASL
jgi:uncharacterized protein